MTIELKKERNPLAESFAAPWSPAGEADYLKLMFVEDLLHLMKEQNITRGELARRMEVQPSRITSMLSGSNNFTIETMVRAARAVGAEYRQCLVPVGKLAREKQAAQTAELRVAENSGSYRTRRRRDK